MGQMAGKGARQHLGLKIGSYKDLFGAELHQLEELNGQMPDFEKGALKRALTNLVKDLTSLKEVKVSHGNGCSRHNGSILAAQNVSPTPPTTLHHQRVLPRRSHFNKSKNLTF